MNIWKSLKPVSIYQWTGYSLLLLGVVNGYAVGYSKIYQQVLLACGICLGVDAAVWWQKTKKYRFSWTALITALIIAEVLAPQELWWHVMVVSFVAIGSKYFLRFKGKTIFNPAAFGLLAAVLLFQAPLVWWGENIPVLVILLGGYILTRLRGRWILIWSFLATLLLCMLFRSVFFNTLFQDQALVLFGTSFFFLFFMLTEPKTSPSQGWTLGIFGGLVALLSVFSSVFIPTTTFLLGLLLANLVSPFLNQLSLPKRASV